MEGNVYPQGKSLQISLPLYTDFDGQYVPHLNSMCDCLYCFSQYISAGLWEVVSQDLLRRLFDGSIVMMANNHHQLSGP